MLVIKAKSLIDGMDEFLDEYDKLSDAEQKSVRFHIHKDRKIKGQRFLEYLELTEPKRLANRTIKVPVASIKTPVPKALRVEDTSGIVIMTVRGRVVGGLSALWTARRDKKPSIEVVIIK